MHIFEVVFDFKLSPQDKNKTSDTFKVKSNDISMAKKMGEIMLTAKYPEILDHECRKVNKIV